MSPAKNDNRLFGICIRLTHRRIKFPFYFLFDCWIFFAIVFIYDADRRDIESGETAAYLFYTDFFLVRDGLEVVIEVGVGVGGEGGEVGVIVGLELILKFQIKTFLIRIIQITYIDTILLPICRRGFDKRFHAAFVQTKSLGKLVNAQLYLAISPYPHLKKIPLPEAMSVSVLSHIEPVLTTVDPHSWVQISTLEFAVKDNVLPSIILIQFIVLIIIKAQF